MTDIMESEIKPEIELIDASPSKEFFINTITRDISLDRAIIDLIDNSVDGARNLINNSAATSFAEFWVEINISNEEFSIKDNCGGFSLNRAIHYAFRFGRDKDAGEVANSIGKFGVGMKRAIFKIGEKFIVESRQNESKFKVDIDVNDWLSNPTDWKFPYIPDSELKINGTNISVSNLTSSTARSFGEDTYIVFLRNEISKALCYPISNGLSIKVNGQKLIAQDIKLIVSDSLKPYYYKEELDGVQFEIFAGLYEPEPDEAGWNIYCNDRLVLDCDKSNITGWVGDGGFEGVRKFHPTLAMFRGAVFFKAESAEKLPMTTTKTGIDINSDVFVKARTYMVTALKQTVNFLNKIETDDQRQELLNTSKPISLLTSNLSGIAESYSLVNKFTYPAFESSENPKLSTITIKVENNFAQKLKERMGVKSNKEVGEILLNYYVEMEEVEL